MGDGTARAVLRREVPEPRHRLLGIPVHQHLRRAAEEDVQARRALLAAVRDVGGQVGREVQADLLDHRLGLRVDDREAELRGFHRREADDAAMADGGEAVAVLRELVGEREPFAVDQGLQRELLHALAQGDVLLRDEAVEVRRTSEGNRGRQALMRNARLVHEVGLECLVDHVLEGDAPEAVGGMDAAVRGHREVQQERGIAPHGLVIGVHQLGQALHVGVLRLVVEPARADAGVRLAGAPDVAVLHAVVQHGVTGLALGGHRAPVGFAHVARFGAHPAEVGAVRVVAPDHAIGLELADELVRLGPLVVGLLDPARLVRAAVPAVTAVGSVEPDLEDVSVIREQFPKLVAEIRDVLRPAVLGVITVPRREIHGELEPFLAACIGQFTDHIALPVLPRRVFHAVIRIGRRPHAEPAVVLGREDDAFHARLLAHARPLAAVQVGRVEQGGILVAEAPLLVRVRVQGIVDEGVHVHVLPG